MPSSTTLFTFTKQDASDDAVNTSRFAKSIPHFLFIHPLFITSVLFSSSLSGAKQNAPEPTLILSNLSKSIQSIAEWKTHLQLRPENSNRNNPHQSPSPLGLGCLGFIHSPLIHSSAQETTSGNSHDYPLISVPQFAAGADSEDSQSHTLNNP